MVTQVDNYNRLALAVASWVKPRAIALVSQHTFVTSLNESLRNSNSLRTFVNMFGLDLRNYSVVDELGFLIEPLLNRLTSTYLVETLQKLASNEEVIPMAKEIVTAALQAVPNKPGQRINVFGIMLDTNDLKSLQDTINQLD